ncbi:NAD-dependent epimerase/dehydratase family protein [Candidatus Omnitrophota bacterium]
MAKILITGQSGDVGSVLFRLYREAGEDIAQLDVTNDVKAERILHLAAKSPPASNSEMIKSNVMYLQQVIEYAKKNDIKELIFFSAASVYGDINKEDVQEDDEWTNPSFYGSLKYLGEELLEESPLSVLCLRFPAILGFRNTTNFLSRLFMQLRDGKDVEITNADKLFNNFVSIESISEFLRQVKLTKSFDVINVASKKEKTLFEMATIIKNALNSQSKIKISDKTSNFFNVSVEKAEKYGFVPEGVELSLKRWVKQRVEYEKVNVS